MRTIFGALLLACAAEAQTPPCAPMVTGGGNPDGLEMVGARDGRIAQAGRVALGSTSDSDTPFETPVGGMPR